MPELVFALAGSPNVGKSTLFNVLTGKKLHVGNWPGKTIERYEGFINFEGNRIRVVDLPGTYSLGAVSDEEIVAREFIVKEKPDVVIVIVNMLEFQPSMYLALQVLELTGKVVIALNKADAALKRGIHIRASRLSRELGVPVVEISALKRMGLRELVKVAYDVARGKIRTSPRRVEYGAFEYYIRDLKRVLEDCKAIGEYPLRWLAIRLLEGDRELEELLKKRCSSVLEDVANIRRRVEEELGSSPETFVIGRRYEIISRLYRYCIALEEISAPSFTEKVDDVLLHPVYGPLISLVMLISTLVAVFSVNTGFPLNVVFEVLGWEDLASFVEDNSLTGLLGMAFDVAASIAYSSLLSLGAPRWFAELVSGGVISGVGGVLSFFPLILTVYIAFGFLEDSGLFARIAVVTDRLARRVGLSGKAVLPLILGFGCNVPSILGTRVLEEERERLLAMLIDPLIPCQARLFVILVVASAVTHNYLVQALFVFSVYTVSLLLLVAVSFLLRASVLKGYEPPDLLIELPPYHRPSFRVLSWYAWDHGMHFIKKAGVVILSLSIVMWFLVNHGPGGAAAPSGSFAYFLGLALVPLGSLAGLGDWRIMLAFEAGFVAKEGMISALMIASQSPNSLMAVSSVLSSIPQAMAFAIAAAIYTPCIPTLIAFYSESKSLKLTFFMVAYELLLAFSAAVLSYHFLELLF